MTASLERNRRLDCGNDTDFQAELELNLPVVDLYGGFIQGEIPIYPHDLCYRVSYPPILCTEYTIVG